MKKGALVIVFVFSLFMGITVISIGLGAAIPAINKISGPFVCPNGSMTMETQRYNPYPGLIVRNNTWYCVDEKTQTRTMLSMFPISMCAGSIYGLLLFALLFFVIRIKTKKSAQ